MSKRPILIGICGKMGSGKDYIASRYVVPVLDNLGVKYLQLSFADQLKVNVMSKYNTRFEDVFVNKTKETRTLLQRTGTENGRNLFGQNVWIKHYEAWTNVFFARGIDVFVTSDLRFKNEIEYFRSRKCIIIQVLAKQRNEQRLQKESNGVQSVYESIKTHLSECDLDDINTDFDIVIHNDENDIVDEERIKLYIHSKVSELMSLHA
jgi:phosphomevalonate kinase